MLISTIPPILNVNIRGASKGVRKQLRPILGGDYSFWDKDVFCAYFLT